MQLATTSLQINSLLSHTKLNPSHIFITIANSISLPTSNKLSLSIIYYIYNSSFSTEIYRVNFFSFFFFSNFSFSFSFSFQFLFLFSLNLSFFFFKSFFSFRSFFFNFDRLFDDDDANLFNFAIDRVLDEKRFICCVIIEKKLIV